MALVAAYVLVLLLIGIAGSAAQVPSYTVTYTEYSESITSLLDVSTTYNGHKKLIGGLYDIGQKSGFTYVQNTTYYNFVNDLETTVINNSSITNETVKLFYAAKAISDFNVSEPVIFGLANQYNITGWSRLSTFVSITNSYHLPTSLRLVYFSSGSVQLFELIKNSLQSLGATAEYTAFQAFIESHLQVIVSSTSLTEADKLAQIYDAFINVFFMQHSSYYNTFYRLDFGIYGNFYQFFQNGLIYYQQSAVPSFVLGDVTTCPLLVQLNASIYNKSLPFPNTVRAQLKQFYLALYQSFETVTTLEGRFEFINAKFGEFCGLQPAYFGWFEYVKFGIFGRFTQIVEYWATRHICGGHFPWDGKPGSDATTTTAGPTTTDVAITSAETVTSTATSSEATITSTGPTSEEVTVSTTVGLSSTTSSEAYSEASTTNSVEYSTSSTTDVTTDVTTSGTSVSTSSSTTGEVTSETTESTSTIDTSTVSTSFEPSSITTETVTDVTSDSSSGVSGFTTLIPSSSTQCTCTCV